MFLAVGQFVYRKGFDILIQAMKEIGPRIGVYIVGGEPTEEYLALKQDLDLNNLHFINFVSKRELAIWYRAADVFVMPTREDIWGLVINEAMSYGVPVISSDRCIAALEMVKNGQNGFVFENENVEQMKNHIDNLAHDLEKRLMFSKNAYLCSNTYTIEKMAKKHMDIFKIMK